MSKTSSKTSAPKKTKNDQTAIIVHVSPADYQAKRARGLTDDETLAPGNHKFVRGGFLNRHPELDPRNANHKERITIWLDADIIEHFKQQAAPKNAPAYQTQINQALRQVLDSATTTAVDAPPTVTLAPVAIKAIAAEVAARLTRKPSRKVA